MGDLMAMKTNHALVEQNGGWWFIFLAGITSNIAVWATLALNIPDFSRFAKGQKEQFWGQMWSMPISMIALAIIGALFAQVTLLAYGTAEYDPTTVLEHLDGRAMTVIVGLLTIIATLTTNVAANTVAPANGFSNLNPKRISYKMGVIITSVLCIAFRPWWIFGSAGAFMFSFLGTVGTVLGPTAAIFVADYFLVKKTRVDLHDLYSEGEGRYTYHNGWNINAFIAWAAAVILPLMYNNFGIGGTVMKWIGANSYLFGFAVAIAIYTLLMKNDKKSYVTEEEFDQITRKCYNDENDGEKVA
jgi:NCS1 family nucleobase:cation symporter-1